MLENVGAKNLRECNLAETAAKAAGAGS